MCNFVRKIRYSEFAFKAFILESQTWKLRCNWKLALFRIGINVCVCVCVCVCVFSGMLALALDDLSLVIVDTETRRVVRKFLGHSGKINDPVSFVCWGCKMRYFML